METRTTASNGKENPFEGAKVMGYVPVNMEGMNPDYDYCIVTAVGNCLNSNLSPVRIKDSDRLVIHQIPIGEWEIMMNMNKVVCFVLNDGRRFVKQLVFWDGLSWGIRVKMFIPEEKSFFVPLSQIKALFVVDKVLDSEYCKATMKPIAGKCGATDGELNIPTQERKTFLTDRNVEALKSTFPDEATYVEHMKTLWALRGLAEKACEKQTSKGVSYDTNSPYFRIVKLTNDLIGALLQNSIHFGCSGKEVYCWKS